MPRFEAEAFTAYDGWTEDLYLAASREIFPGGPNETPIKTIEAQQRLLKALKPKRCGKVMSIPLYKNEPNYEWSSYLWAEQPITCRLPLNHHIFSPNGYGACDFFIPTGQCGKRGNDEIHSPGHVPNIPEEAWKE